MTPDLLAHHLGALHPVEQALTLALAFGPFLALGVVILLRRRQDRIDEERVEREEREEREAREAREGRPGA